MISIDQVNKDPMPVDVVVTTYDMITADRDWFLRACVWRYVVLDEGHRIKNNQAKHAKVLQKLRSHYRLVLTGLVSPRSLPVRGLYIDFCFQRTPVQNDLSELWSILNWLFPEIFTPRTSIPFKEAFFLSAGKVDLGFLAHARNLLKLIMLRRLKDSPGVGIGIPPKMEITLLVPPTKLQRNWYSRLLTGFDQSLLDELLLESRKTVEQSGFRENGFDNSLKSVAQDWFEMAQSMDQSPSQHQSSSVNLPVQKAKQSPYATEKGTLP